MKNQMIFKRYEIKYILTAQQKDLILSCMEPYMRMDEFGRTTIRNIYYDTDSYRLIRNSLEKPVYKEKLRVRSYGRVSEDEPVFVELKKKYDSIVYKRRIKVKKRDADECLGQKGKWPEDTQIARELGYFCRYYQKLAPKVFLSYEREAYYALDGSDFRITFDENILFRQDELTLDSEPYGESLLEEGYALMELKTSRGIPMWLVKCLSENNIRRTSFSKYGTAYRKMCMENRICIGNSDAFRAIS